VKRTLSADEVKAMLLHVASRVAESADVLNDADRAIGDGDHGLAMTRGFEAARKELASHEYETVGASVSDVGRALLLSMGGASGILFSSLFVEGARALSAERCFGSPELARFLSDGTDAVEQRGKSAPGGKTMVDALAPAARTAAELRAAPIAHALPRVAEAARGGVEATKEMVALAGKAKSLGARSVGHADPGALSVHVMLQAMDEYVAGRAVT
jgi:phosphoenolpyruvate---glycerone phosphotransferase subunit DhaL